MTVSTVAAAAPAVTSVFQVIVTEIAMLISGVVGWFTHSVFVTSTVSKIEAAIKKVSTPATPVTTSAPASQ